MKFSQAIFATVACALTLSSPYAAAKSNDALAGLKTHLHNLQLKQAGKKVSNKKALTECAQLSGSWKGHCTESDNSDGYEADVVIDQYDCNDVTIGTDDMPIGGALNIGSTSPNFMYSGVAFPDWNASGTVLRLKVSLAGRQMGDDSYFFSEVGSIDYQIVNGQLISRTISDNTTEVSGQHSQEKSWEECTFDKVSR